MIRRFLLSLPLLTLPILPALADPLAEQFSSQWQAAITQFGNVQSFASSILREREALQKTVAEEAKQIDEKDKQIAALQKQIAEAPKPVAQAPQPDQPAQQ